MKKAKITIVVLLICVLLTACGKPAAESAPDIAPAESEQTAEEASGLRPEIAKAYLAVMDEVAEHLGYDEAEASVGECLYGGFVRDWDGDGTPELCLLLKTSPRDSGGWDGTPLYGWYPPTLYLYTYQDGQAIRAAECDLYFATAGREAAIAALTGGNGTQLIWWDRTDITEETYLSCLALDGGRLREAEIPADAAAASESVTTAQAFLETLGAGRVQLLLYNCIGEARIEGEANARELRAELAAIAS